jgi:hypothetical protein
MGTKTYCDLCGKFIAEYGMHKPQNSGLNRPSIISTYFEGKSVLEEYVGWSGPKEKVEFWACDECNRKFMDGIKALAVSMGLKI